ncbi:MAG: ATP-binding protein [Candidatus Aminicenantes bacterium]|jgi:signal transduction histidine kinase
MGSKLTGFKQFLVRIYTDRTIPEENTDLQRRVILLNIIFTIGIVTLVPYSVIAYKQGSFWLGVFDLAISVILAGSYVYLRRSKNYTVTGYICISLVSLLILYVTCTGGHNNTGPLWSYTVPMFVLFLLGIKKGSVFMGIYFSIVLLILFFPGTPLLFTTYSRDFKVRYATTFAVVYAIAFFAEWVRTKTQEKMARKAEELEKTLEELGKAEAERNHLHDQLLTAQKMEAIGILAGGIAHDFNNMLTVIIGNLGLALEEIESNPKWAAKMLKSAEKASIQAIELSQRLITFSKGGWIVPREVSLSVVLKDITDQNPDMKTILLSTTTTVPAGLKSLYGDERYLSQAIQNLLVNAHEAAAQPGQITLEAENVTLEKDNDFELKAGDYVKISITDNGPGIPREQLGKIFDPYFSTKNTVTQKGLGLGLAICYSIIKKHNGHIAIKSEIGKGTTVELHLPAYSESLIRE